MLLIISHYSNPLIIKYIAALRNTVYFLHKTVYKYTIPGLVVTLRSGKEKERGRALHNILGTSALLSYKFIRSTMGWYSHSL